MPLINISRAIASRLNIRLVPFQVSNKVLRERRTFYGPSKQAVENPSSSRQQKDSAFTISIGCNVVAFDVIGWSGSATISL